MISIKDFDIQNQPLICCIGKRKKLLWVFHLFKANKGLVWLLAHYDKNKDNYVGGISRHLEMLSLENGILTFNNMSLGKYIFRKATKEEVEKNLEPLKIWNKYVMDHSLTREWAAGILDAKYGEGTVLIDN